MDGNIYSVVGVVIRILSVFMLMFIIAPAAFVQWFLGRSDTRMWLKRKRFALLAGFGSAAILCVPSIMAMYIQSLGAKVPLVLHNISVISGSLALFVLVLTITSFYWSPYIELLKALFKKGK